MFGSIAGWALSALGQLNRSGYAIALGVFVIFLWLGRKKLDLLPRGQFFCWKKIQHRFRRPLPLGFAVLALLIFLGGALYPPSNYTGITYHVPRVLHWLSHEQWYWIHTPVVRMNYSGCAFEWLNVPLLLFTRSDRALFLLNYIPFLLLPGLVFSAFTRLGVRPKAARQWMWLLPTGYIFILQAGSIGNDAFTAICALVMIDFGCRAWESRRLGDLLFSLLAAALMTGTKAISLPLLLPWLVLVFMLLPLLRKNWLATSSVMALAVIVSFLPLALINNLHSGDWLGRSVESAQSEIHQPLIGVAGNVFQLLLANFLPPIFPPAGWWNLHAPLFMPRFIVDAVNANFDTGFFTVGELPTEDWTGVGFGISVLLVVSVLGSIWFRGTAPRITANRPIPPWLCRCVLLAAWISFMVYCMKSGLTTAARLVAPYYPLLLLSLLIGPFPSKIIRRNWWRVLVGGTLASAFIVLILSPDRPLWPAKTILSKIHAQYPDERLITRALKVYTVYSERFDALAGVRALLPPDIKTVGFIGTKDDTDISLWRPFGTRRVEHFLLSDPSSLIRQKVQYVVVGGYNLKQLDTTLEGWMEQSGTQLVASTNVVLKVGEGLQPWYIVRFKE
ncbi:MAG: hypothetical protein WDM76_19690 [Limisphaerales bacterium]